MGGSGPSPPPASLACPCACHLPPETPRSPRAGQGPCSSSTPLALVGLCQGAGRSLKRLARSPTVRPWARHLHPGTLPLLSPAGPGSGTLVPCAPPFPAHGPSGHPSCAVPRPPRPGQLSAWLVWSLRGAHTLSFPAGGWGLPLGPAACGGQTWPTGPSQGHHKSRAEPRPLEIHVFLMSGHQSEELFRLPHK